MIKKFIKRIQKIAYIVVKKILLKIFSLPIIKISPKKIVFSSYSGKGYGCNPKYIAEELIKQDVDCDMVWLVNDLNCEMPSKIRKVKYGSIKAYYELATAKIWIDNVRLYKGVEKKKNQFYIQTWHASFSLKKIEGQVEEQLSEIYVNEAKNDGKITDLMFANNQYTVDLIKKFFWYDGEVAKIGIPRNDIIKNPTNDIYQKVYKYFNIDSSKRIVLYAPTFRNNNDMELYKFDYKDVCKILKDTFGGEFIMLLRLHPNISQYSNMLNFSDYVLDATDYPDMQELLATSEILITDYSSSMFDFSMFNKIVFLFSKDIEQYKKDERNLEFQLEDLPFSIADSDSKLIDDIKSFSKEKYMEACKKFYKEIGLVNDKNASIEIVEIIKKEMKNEERLL